MGQVTTSGHTTVRNTQKNLVNSDLYFCKLELFNLTADVQYTHCMRLFHSVKWPTSEVKPEDTMDMLGLVAITQRSTTNADPDSVKMVVEDSKGGS